MSGLLLTLALVYGYGGCNGVSSTSGRHTLPPNLSGSSNTSNTSSTTNTTNNTNTNNANNTNNNTNNTNNVPAGTDPHVAAALNAVNETRAAHGLNPLTLDPALDSCALRHAQDAAACANNQIANAGPCSHTDFAAGDTCGAFSENAGQASNTSSGNEDANYTMIQNAWLSEGPPPAGQSNHYSNLLDPARTTVGIGLYIDPNGNLWINEVYK